VLSTIVAIQVVIIFILISVGFVLKKIEFIDQHGTKQLTNILLMVVTPCVLINSYQKEFKPELAFNLFMATLFSVALHTVMVLISTLIYRKEPSNHYRINIFSASSSNCGFMAIPLLTAVLKDMGVFYGSAYLAVFNIFYWTYGICIYTGSTKALSLKKAFINPGVIGTVIGLVLFICRITLPRIVLEPIQYLSGLNTPLAMIILGSYLANINLKKTLAKISIYTVSALRLIVFPVLAIIILLVSGLDRTAATAVLISVSCPIATVTPLFATKFGLDAEYASELVSVSTLLSIITIPLIMMLFQNVISVF